MTDKANRVTGYFHDALGRRFATVFPDGSTMTNYFDALGRVIATTDERGNPTWFGYDERGMRVSLTNALGEVTRFDYDENGNQVAMIDALGRTNRYELDVLNRRVAVVLPDGTRSVTAFDDVGRRIAQTDQSTNTTAFAYDARGLLLAVTNALGHVTRYEYDEQGRQVTQIDALNRPTRYEYDRLGRRTKRTLPLNQIETYAYNAAGNLTAKTDFNGRTTTYTHDSLNRLTARVPDPAFSAPLVTFAYNGLGLRTNMTDASGMTTYRYDNRNRLVEKATPQGTLLYAYDAHGNVTNISSTTPDGVRLSYGYDTLNHLGLLADPHAGTTTYSYDPVGNLSGYLLPNDVLNLYAYDSLNRLTNLTARRFLNTLANYAYTVNPSGHRATATETLIRNPLNPAPYTISRLYHYDATYRLTNETIGAPQLSTPATLNYSYDTVGNRVDLLSTLAEIPSTSYGYDLNDRLTSDTYDNNGNTLTAPGFGMAQPDRYDFENRLIERTVSGKTVTITYDGDGNRVAKTVTTSTNTVTTLFLVDTLNPTGYAQVLEEHVSTDSQPFALNHVYGFGHTLLSQDQLLNGVWTVRYHGLDGHGNTRYLTDLIGDITDTYDFDAFGNLIAATGSISNNFLFTSEQSDPDLGLYFLRARYLDPATDRFWTIDELDGAQADPISLHKYLYADANPVSKIDPTGHASLAEQQFTSGFMGEMQVLFRTVSNIYRAYDKASSLVETVNTIYGIAKIISSGGVTAAIDASLQGINQKVWKFSVSQVIDSFERNASRILYTGFPEWAPKLFQMKLKGTRTDSYDIYMPNPFGTGSSLPAPTGLKINDIPVRLRFGGTGSGRILGAGITVRGGGGGHPIQFFRMDVGLSHPRPLKPDEIAMWDDPPFFSYHVRRF
jgi:RHS repeat-associated protein